MVFEAIIFGGFFDGALEGFAVIVGFREVVSASLDR